MSAPYPDMLRHCCIELGGKEKMGTPTFPFHILLCDLIKMCVCVCVCVTFIAYSDHMAQIVKLTGVYFVERIMGMHNDLAVMYFNHLTGACF